MIVEKSKTRNRYKAEQGVAVGFGNSPTEAINECIVKMDINPASIMAKIRWSKKTVKERKEYSKKMHEAKKSKKLI